MFFRAPDRHGREVNSRNFPTVLCQPQRVSALAAAHIEGDAGWDVAGIFQQHGVGVSRPQPVFFLVAGVPFGLALGLLISVPLHEIWAGLTAPRGTLRDSRWGRSFVPKVLHELRSESLAPFFV